MQCKITKQGCQFKYDIISSESFSLAIFKLSNRQINVKNGLFIGDARKIDMPTHFIH